MGFELSGNVSSETTYEEGDQNLAVRQPWELRGLQVAWNQAHIALWS